MAKRKRKSSKKSVESAEKSPFWAMAGGVLMILGAIFVLLGSFGGGGPLPQSLFEAAYWALGWVAYFTPITLIFFGVLKFTREDHEIPLSKFISSLVFLITAASFFHIAFVSQDAASGIALGGNGGNVGKLIGGITLNAINKIPASIMFAIFSMLAFFFAFNISPDVLLKLGTIFKRPESKDSDLEKLQSDNEFKINEGVPIEHHGRTRASLKNSAQKLTVQENHEALITTSDPTWKLPPLDLLNKKQDKANPGDVEEKSNIIKNALANFNIDVKMGVANVGPRVTQYTLKPSDGVKLNKLPSYADNLAYSLAATSIRVEAPIPGKTAVGIEVPNEKSATVRTSSIFTSAEWGLSKSLLSLGIGKDIGGNAVVEDLDEMPHLLVAGQTKAGKSVMINNILASLLFRNSPSDLKLILVDPKHVELKPYDGIPHLLTPVITDPEKCISALKWTVAEMERRYRTLSDEGYRDIGEYNSAKKDEGMPYIVVIIDELADLMMMAARDVEALIVRIAQKARAVGIHLILATQRPSVNVITGLIKANIPARVAFTVASQVDSRTILDQAGAEKLLGKGDMLLKTDEKPKPIRVQGALIETAEVRELTKFLRNQRDPQYDEEVVSQPVQLDGRGGVVAQIDDTDEPIYRDAVRVAIEGKKASTSLLQRRLRIGYSKAARLIEGMEEQGIIGPANGSRPREVLVSSLDEVFNDGNSTASIDDEE